MPAELSLLLTTLNQSLREHPSALFVFAIWLFFAAYLMRCLTQRQRLVLKRVKHDFWFFWAERLAVLFAILMVGLVCMGIVAALGEH